MELSPKVLFVLLDGLGDVGCPLLQGQTPLQYAETPWMDQCAASGWNGLMDPVEPGLACGSDTAHLSIFGYDPRRYYRGRGALETMGAGLSMEPGDIAFKSNFAVLDPESGVVLSRRADRALEREGPILCESLNNTTVPGYPDYQVAVQYATEHRCGVRVRGPNLTDAITGTDPLKDGRTLLQCEPTTSTTGEPTSPEEAEAQRKTCDFINALSKHFHQLLSQHPVNKERKRSGKPPANCVLFRGCGMRLKVPSLQERHSWLFPKSNHPHPGAFVIAPTCIIRGLGWSLGMQVLDVAGATGDYRTNLDAKADAAVHHLLQDQYNFGFVHVKAVDDAGHDFNLECKCEWLEKADRMVGRIVQGLVAGAAKSEHQDFVLVITGDHSTPVALGDHSCEPTPFLVCSVQNVHRRMKGDRVERFSEVDAARGSLGRFPGLECFSIIRNFTRHRSGAGGAPVVEP